MLIIIQSDKQTKQSEPIAVI